MRPYREDMIPVLAILVAGSIGALGTANLVSGPAESGSAEVRTREAVPVTTIEEGDVAQPGVITGSVTDANSGRPVASAQVYVEALRIGVLTRQDGSYILLGVPSGTHTVTVERIGYREASAEVSPEGGETATLDFQVAEEALRLDEVIVTAVPSPR